MANISMHLLFDFGAEVREIILYWSLTTSIFE